MRIQLPQQVALVTGGAHRVGRAIALCLAQAGAHVLIHYHQSDDATVRDTLHALKSHGVEADAVQADLATADGVATVFAAVRERFGRLHILVNSASIFQKRSLLDVTLDEWRQTLDINLTAPFLCTQAAVPLMRETLQKDTHSDLTDGPASAAIINICDKGALEPWPDYAHHGISKAGLLMLTKVSAASLGPDVRVNAIIPGAVLKPPTYSDERWAQSGARVPLQRNGTAEDVGRAVVYLAAEPFISGAVLTVDGGDSVV
jgi:pteridine reductase